MVSIAVLCDGLFGRLGMLQVMTCKGCTGALYTLTYSKGLSENLLCHTENASQPAIGCRKFISM